MRKLTKGIIGLGILATIVSCENEKQILDVENVTVAQETSDQLKSVDLTRELLKLQEIIEELFGIPKYEVQPEASFINDLGLDSLDWVELMIACEEEFEIELLYYEGSFSLYNGTVFDLISYIHEMS